MLSLLCVVLASTLQKSETNHWPTFFTYNAGAEKNARKTEWVIEVELSNAEVERCPETARNLWRYPNRPLSLQAHNHRVYRFDQHGARDLNHSQYGARPKLQVGQLE